MKSFATRKRAGFLAILLAFVFAFTGIMPVVSNAEEAGNYDIDKPVIGELMMTHNGETVSSDTSLDITLKAEDLGVGIKSVQVSFDFISDNGDHNSYYRILNFSIDDTQSSLSYDEKNSVYTGNVSLKDIPRAGILYISDVEVRDKNDNISTLDGLTYYSQNTNKYKYFVNVNPNEENDSNSVIKATPVVRSNGQYTEAPNRTFESGHDNYMKIEFAQPVSEDIAYFVVNYKIGTSLLDRQCSSISDDRKVLYAYGVDGITSPGKTFKCSINSIHAVYNNGTTKLITWGNTDTSYLLHSAEEQNHRITEISVFKDNKEIKADNILTNGQVKEGDTLTFKVKIDKDNLKTSDIYYAALQLGRQDTNRWAGKTISLAFDQNTQIFTGTLTIDAKMYPTIWSANQLILEDINYHTVVFDSDKSDLFIVNHGSTTVIPQIKPYVDIEYFSADEDTYLVDGVNLDSIDAYSKIPVEKLNLPKDPESPVKGAKFIGWYVFDQRSDSEGDGTPLSDFRFQSDSTLVYIYPKFDKNTTILDGTYIDKNGLSQKVHKIGLTDSVYDQKTAEDYLNKTYEANKNVDLKANYKPWVVSFSSVTKQGINGLSVWANYITDKEHEYKTVMTYYKGELTENVFNSAIKHAEDMVGNSPYKADQITKWDISNTDYNDFNSYVKFINNKGIYIPIFINPEYKNGYKARGLYFSYPGGEYNCFIPFLAKDDEKFSDIEDRLSTEKLPDDFDRSLQFIKWKFIFNKDTKVSDLFNDEDALSRYEDGSCSGYAVTNKSYVIFSVYDNDKPDDEAYVKTLTIVANDKNQIELPGKIDGYKYVTYTKIDGYKYTTFDDVDKKAEHGGVIHRDNESNPWIVAVVSNKEQPVLDDDNKSSDNKDDKSSTDNTGKTPSNNTGKQEVTVPTTDTSVNTATNASDAERAAVNANPDKLIVVEATKDHDGGVKAAPSVVEQEVKAVADAVSKAKSKKAIVKIDMNGANIIPVEVLKEAKGKNVDVIFNMGDYSWTVNGMNIGNIDLKDINLAVDMNTNAIPSDVVKALSGSKPTQQISLRHNGNFGFKATLEMKAPKGEAGKYGNLYWYDSDKKLVFQDSALVKADGTIRLNFSHASDYVIVFGDNMATKSPKTGANVNKNALLMMALMLTLAAASGIFGMMELREANRKRV